ncbi:hypothetical protein GO986_00590 [Deinococcus sp. HMF7620]|uniref:Uncharacterized protein n=1 Tax=Deinococcus arboris TaxID=2682977 RepID=A0A7C9HW01_9DEIO|nr:hypothetical protein [Deinococcus arboris]MVN85268.1 hypothetical protein [Deinococcus arboris]
MNGINYLVSPFLLSDGVSSRELKNLEIYQNDSKIVGFRYTFWEYDAKLSSNEREIIRHLLNNLSIKQNDMSAFNDLKYLPNKKANFIKYYDLSDKYKVSIAIDFKLDDGEVITHVIKGSDGRPERRIYPVSFTVLPK